MRTRYKANGDNKKPVFSAFPNFGEAISAVAAAVLSGYKKHHRVDHGRNEFVKHKAHINGIENFWGIAKMRLAKFRGLNRSTLRLHLKECEFRFNHRCDNLYQLLLNNFKNNPLN
jgi:transposase